MFWDVLGTETRDGFEINARYSKGDEFNYEEERENYLLSYTIATKQNKLSWHRQPSD